MTWLRSLSAGVRWGLGVAVGVLILFAGWYVFLRPQQAAREAATAKTETISAEAQTGAATDTVRIVVDRQTDQVRIIKTTEENSREILAQPSATTGVDAALHAAGLRALCMHDNVSDVSCAIVLHRDDGGDRAGEANASRRAP